MQKFDSRIFLLIAAVLFSLWLPSCTPQPDTDLIPVIKVSSRMFRQMNASYMRNYLKSLLTNSLQVSM